MEHLCKKQTANVLCNMYMKLLGIPKATKDRPILRNDFCEIPESQWGIN